MILLWMSMCSCAASEVVIFVNTYDGGYDGWQTWDWNTTTILGIDTHAVSVALSRKARIYFA